MRKSRLEEHNRTMKRLQNKKEIAELKYAERQLKFEILKTYFPFLGKKIRFSKKIVIFSIVAIVIYTISAFKIQRDTGIEISAILTSSFFAFFGVEMGLLSKIKREENKNCHDDYIGE